MLTYSLQSVRLQGIISDPVRLQGMASSPVEFKGITGSTAIWGIQDFPTENNLDWHIGVVVTTCLYPDRYCVDNTRHSPEQSLILKSDQLWVFFSRAGGLDSVTH